MRRLGTLKSSQVTIPHAEPVLTGPRIVLPKLSNDREIKLLALVLHCELDTPILLTIYSVGVNFV